MKHRHLGTGAAALAVLLLLGGQEARAKKADLMVDDDRVQCPKADYADLQEAVDAARPWETLIVCPGLYPGTITIAADKIGLTLWGRTRGKRERIGDPSREAVLDGSPEGQPGFAVKAPDVTITGFTIQDTGGTGIEVRPEDGDTPLLRAWIGDNHLDTLGDPSAKGTACAGGRGINVEGVAAAVVMDNEIVNSCGAGIRLKSATEALIERNMIDGSRKRPGIAVRGGDSHRIIANTSFNNREGGISLHDSVDNVVVKNLMKGNGVPGDPLRPIPGPGSNTDADDTTNLPLENAPENTWKGNHCLTENRRGLCAF